MSRYRYRRYRRRPRRPTRVVNYHIKWDKPIKKDDEMATQFLWLAFALFAFILFLGAIAR